MSRSGARVEKSAQRDARPGVITRLQNHAALHFHVMTTSLGQLGRGKAGNLMTAIVLGIALCLPAMLHVLVERMAGLSDQWRQSGQMSVFLQMGVKDAAAEKLASELRTWPELAVITYIPAQQALLDFKQQSGMGELLAMLDDNPLPGVLVVQPQPDLTPAQLQPLASRMQSQSIVELVQLDMEWAQRLHAMLLLVERGVLVLGSLLVLAVLFVVGNTIRLAIESRRDEIEVVKLIGGSDAFVRRPFLYYGMWFGLFGGLLAWLMVNILLLLLKQPVAELAGLYGSDFQLGLVDLRTTLLLLLCGPLLGWLGAWLAAYHHLRAIEPS